MAPSSPRRPGFSRRVQYSLFAGYVGAILGLLLAVLLIATAQFDPAGHAAVQGVLSDIFAPISKAGRRVVRAGQSAFDETGAYFEAASKNRAMSAELKASRAQLIKGKSDALENARLKRMLGILPTSGDRAVAAYLVSSTGASSRRYATFGAGARDGIENGQPVHAPDGLVGRVIQTGRSVSRVLLITDTGNIVPVKRASDGVPALAVGTGTGAIELRSLTAGRDPFRLGDIFVTSGTGGIYRPGIPVAVAIRHGRDKTIARPFADPAALDFAFVEPIFMIQPPPARSDLPKDK